MAGGFGVQNSACPEDELIAELVGQLFQSLQSARDGHRHFSSAHATVINSLNGQESRLCGSRPDDGDKADLRDSGQNLLCGHFYKVSGWQTQQI